MKNIDFKFNFKIKIFAFFIFSTRSLHQLHLLKSALTSSSHGCGNFF